MPYTPTLRAERALLRCGHRLVAGMDEVGRGALAGPVTVGVVVVDTGTRTAPAGVRDSKDLTPLAREALAPRIRRWGVARAVGHAEPDEIDRWGILAALGLAACRALAALPELPGCVLLDGTHDWLSPRMPRADGGETQAPTLFECAAPVPAGPELPVSVGAMPIVVTQVKADRRCASVAAASVLAKVTRDAIMVIRGAGHPGYGWEENKGYSTPEHAAALTRFGPCEQHRRSWQLPVLGQPIEDTTHHPSAQAGNPTDTLMPTLAAASSPDPS